jgi:hypothetical protein
MSRLGQFWVKFVVLALMLLGLPLTGVWLAGYPVDRYLQFPPKTLYIQHARFSWIAFSVYAVSIVSVLLAFSIIGIRFYQRGRRRDLSRFAFPWWGWAGLAAGCLAWILAWTRFPWFADIQPHTFTPLWLCYILVINAMCFRRTGRCLITDRPGFLLLLFPTSAAFWWFFEYLNRFVQNWYYLGSQYSAWSYFWLATLPFSTVLPAVLSTRELFQSARWLRCAFGRLEPIRVPRAHWLAGAGLLVSAFGLAGVGLWPDYLFPLVWVSPLLIIVCLQTLMNERHVFSDMTAGDWHMAVASCLAALQCGFFWELWNAYSLAKWRYSIPFVGRFRLFEMPILGYAGYLPFGLGCTVIGDLLTQAVGSSQKRMR